MPVIIDVTRSVERIWAGEEPRTVLSQATRAQVEIVRKELALKRQCQKEDFNFFIEEKWGQGG